MIPYDTVAIPRDCDVILATVPRQIIVRFKRKIAVSILFLHQFLSGIRESTGKNISFPRNIRPPSVDKHFVKQENEVTCNCNPLVYKQFPSFTKCMIKRHSHVVLPQ